LGEKNLKMVSMSRKCLEGYAVKVNIGQPQEKKIKGICLA
jgi:hypothetical protein